MTRIVINPSELRSLARALEETAREREQMRATLQHAPLPEMPAEIAGEVRSTLRRCAHRCDVHVHFLERERRDLIRRAERMEVDLALPARDYRLIMPRRVQGRNRYWLDKPIEETDDLDLLLGAGSILKFGVKRAGRPAAGALGRAGGAVKSAGSSAISKLGSLFGRKPEHVRRMERGNRFNDKHYRDYDHNEVRLHKPPHSKPTPTGRPSFNRLDSYDAGSVIVSRTSTQLANVQERSAIRKLRELATKYPPGQRIADVPSNHPSLRGGALDGRMILEVPVQKKEIPQAVLDEAKRLRIEIRDVKGKIYR